MPDDITRIPGARSKFLNDAGEVDRVWYRFLYNQFVLTGSGTSSNTVDDIQILDSGDPVSKEEVSQLFQQVLLDIPPTQPLVKEDQFSEPAQTDLSYIQSQIDALNLVPPALPAPSTLPVSSGGTGTSTAFTTGSVVFAGTSGVYSQDNSNFYFDDTNNRLAVGTNDTTGGTNAAISAVSSTTTAIKFQGNSTGVKGILYSDASNIGVLDTTGNNGLLVTPGTSLDLRTSTSTPRLTISNAGDVTINTHDLIINTAGKGLKVKEGSNAKMGRAVLVGGTVTVSTTAVASTSEIFLTNRITGGTIGSLSVGTVTAGTSFVINSTNVLDTSTICWLIVDPA
jgi:hypothetical protein